VVFRAPALLHHRPPTVSGPASADCKSVSVDGEYHQLCGQWQQPQQPSPQPPQQSPGVDAWGNILWGQDLARAIQEDRRQRFEREMQERQFQHEREMQGR